MKKKDKRILGLVVIVLLIILIWPKIVIQEKFLETDYLSNSIIFGFWNRGAILEGFYIITPEACVSAKISKNISCTHSSYAGPVNCSHQVCRKASAGGISEDIFNLNFPENRPENFTIKVKSLAMVGGIFPTWYTSKNFICNLDENKRDYHCKKK